MFRQSWRPLVLLPLLFGLFGCHHAKEQRREAEMALLREDVRAAREDIARLADETLKIRELLERSPERVMDPALQRMQLDLAAVRSMRLAVSESYYSMGKMPADNAVAGLSEPPRYRGRSLTSATVRKDGSIELVFDANSGVDGGRIVFTPDLTNAEVTGISWHCETADYPFIKRIEPLCEYAP